MKENKKFMKRLLTLGLTLGMTFTLAACSNNTSGGTVMGSESSTSSTDSTEASSDSSPSSLTAEGLTVTEGVLTVATYAEFPPYATVTQGDGVSGTGFQGMDIALVAAMATELDLDIEIQNMDFAAAVTAVESGKADVVISGVTMGETAVGNLAYSDSYATAVQVMLVPEYGDIETIEDLDGLTIGAQEETAGYFYGSADREEGGFGAENMVTFASGSLAVDSLLLGKVSGVIMDKEGANAFLTDTAGLRMIALDYPTADYGLGVKQNNKDLLEVINAVLDSLETQGVLEDLTKTYFK